MSAVVPQTLKIPIDILTPDHIKNEVDSRVIAVGRYDILEGMAIVIDCPIRPQLFFAEGLFLFVAHSRVYNRAEMPCQLNGAGRLSPPQACIFSRWLDAAGLTLDQKRKAVWAKGQSVSRHFGILGKAGKLSLRTYMNIACRQVENACQC